jgi:hypothetical protein
MGVISDFIIATEPEALEYSRSQTGVPPSDVLGAKNITCVELSTLFAILKGEEWKEEFLDLFPFVGDTTSGVTLVAGALVERLTDFDYDLDEVSTHWAATEEMQWEPEEARGLIDDLAQHALKSQRLGKPVYLWNCA